MPPGRVAGPLDAYLAASDAVVAALATDQAAAAAKVPAVRAAQDAFDAPFDGVAEAVNRFATDVQRQARDDARRNHQITLVALVGACLLLPAVGLVIRRTIERSTGAILEVVTTAADGDLTREVTVTGDDALGRMGAGAVAAIDEIGSIISQINDIQTMIAGAVEEQTAATSEISRSVDEAASSSQEIAGAITGVAQATAEASSGVAETRRAAEELAGMAAELQRLVGQFTC